MFGREHSLTRAQKKLFSFLVERGEPELTISVNELVAATDISRRTVQVALSRLNDVGLIQTLPGYALKPSCHRVRKLITDAVEPVDGGAK